MVPLNRPDVDTDQIMPKQFLKRIERVGFGEFIFLDWRADPEFVLNDPSYADANVLLAGANFGTGSSREHAPWGLQEYGFDAIIAPSFADIFRSNCMKIGLLTVELDQLAVDTLMLRAAHPETNYVRIDLGAQSVESGELQASFDIDANQKHLLMEGLDEIALTLGAEKAITAYEGNRAKWLPDTRRSPGTALHG